MAILPSFIKMLVTGLRLGSVYALIALGYTMVYGVLKFINFAHGDFIMVGGYTLLFTAPIMSFAGFPAWTAVFFAVAVCAAVSVLTEMIAYRPVRKRGNSMSALITAIAMSLILENFAQYLISSTNTGYGAAVCRLFPPGKINFSGVSISLSSVISIITGIVIMILLYLLVNKTKIGRAMRAVSEDKYAAEITGVNVNRIVSVTFAIGGALAAAAALMWFSEYSGTTPVIGTTLGMFAFSAAVLGGIGSIPGAVLGGFIIGLSYSFTTAYISSGFADAVVFIILILILILKPTGLLRRNEGEKV